jgi:hypothetical protein
MLQIFFLLISQGIKGQKGEKGKIMTDHIPLINIWLFHQQL